ncbi:MAG: S-methyl-5-thioribose-1-phosphate isomerase [Halanaerobiales bacterium]
MQFDTIKFKNNSLYLIDQRKLPGSIDFFQADDYRDVVFAIVNMVVRGAPAIGAAAAYGVYLAAKEFSKLEKDIFLNKIKNSNQELKGARPTAVNLSWAVGRMELIINNNKEYSSDIIVEKIKKEADKILIEDIKTNKAMAAFGNIIVPEQAVILTHCNTGALATVDYGTALGVIREAHNSGKKIKVYADETRPRLQGARLTAFELVEEGIDAALIADSVAPTLIRDGKIDLILVGADRIAANGDTANKIGTYMLSEFAVKFNVPFYVVAPISTIDFDIETGEEIEIEERSSREVSHIKEVQIAPENIDIYNPAFDVTPFKNITGIITEKGIIKAPYKQNIKKINKR